MSGQPTIRQRISPEEPVQIEFSGCRERLAYLIRFPPQVYSPIIQDVFLEHQLVAYVVNNRSQNGNWLVVLGKGFYGSFPINHFTQVTFTSRAIQSHDIHNQLIKTSLFEVDLLFEASIFLDNFSEEVLSMALNMLQDTLALKQLRMFRIPQTREFFGTFHLMINTAIRRGVETGRGFVFKQRMEFKVSTHADDEYSWSTDGQTITLRSIYLCAYGPFFEEMFNMYLEYFKDLQDRDRVRIYILGEDIARVTTFKRVHFRGFPNFFFSVPPTRQARLAASSDVLEKNNQGGLAVLPGLVAVQGSAPDRDSLRNLLPLRGSEIARVDTYIVESAENPDMGLMFGNRQRLRKATPIYQFQPIPAFVIELNVHPSQLNQPVILSQNTLGGEGSYEIRFNKVADGDWDFVLKCLKDRGRINRHNRYNANSMTFGNFLRIDIDEVVTVNFFKPLVTPEYSFFVKLIWDLHPRKVVVSFGGRLTVTEGMIIVGNTSFRKLPDDEYTHHSIRSLAGLPERAFNLAREVVDRIHLSTFFRQVPAENAPAVN